MHRNYEHPAVGRLEQLAEFLESSDRDGKLVRKEINRDLLQAASYGFDQLTVSEIGTFMRRACKVGEALPHEIHRKIVSLGPRCFITTNYDHLLEDSLRKWQPNRSYNTITNRQPFEEANIIQVRALDFVFKPHGDVSDAESIILTKEQYRKMFEGGELKHTLESLKTLFVTRRVVYLGFGLRDPDFLMISDVVANTWKGGTRDHYAIIADVESGEINYWRKNYGIHLVSYETTVLPDGRRDHSALLQLLDALRDPTPPDAEIAVPDDSTAKLILPLLRYANGLMRFEAVSPEFPLRVHTEKSPHVTSAHDAYFDRWEHKEADKFLEEGPPRAILIGLPGAGKTYALKKACSRLAEQVYQAFLADPPMLDKTIIPVFVDMKSYAGDIMALLDACFPSGLSFRHLASRFPMKVFLDSINEIPRQQWESGAHEIDLGDFLRDFPQVNVVFGSRTKDGLEKLGLPVYFLDEIDQTFVREELKRRNTELTGRFESELLSLLQKPFYFHLLNSGHVKFNAEPHPRDVYRLFFEDLSTAFSERFGEKLDLEAALAGAAYEAISRGEEAQPIQTFLRAVKKELQSAGFSTPTADDVANWLVGKSVLIPYSGRRVAFFHQSVTEYLAARDLAHRYLTYPEILKEKLSLTRWDQAIFLTLSFLTPPAEEEFIRSIMDIDFALALNAAKYVEVNREIIVTKLLSEIPNRIGTSFSSNHRIGWALEYNVPVTETNEPQLIAIMNIGNSIGASAAARLLETKGGAVKGMLLQSLLDRRFDYNYCTRVGRALQTYINQSDLESIAKMTDSIEGEMNDDHDDASTLGFIVGVAESICRIPLVLIESEFLYYKSDHMASRGRPRIVLAMLRNGHSQSTLTHLSAILRRESELLLTLVATC